MELDILEIQKIIPHRFPFLLIDRVVDLEPNKKLIAIKNVSVNEQFFVGHFPDEKVMPGITSMFCFFASSIVGSIPSTVS